MTIFRQGTADTNYSQLQAIQEGFRLRGKEGRKGKEGGREEEKEGKKESQSRTNPIASLSSERGAKEATFRYQMSRACQGTQVAQLHP